MIVVIKDSIKDFIGVSDAIIHINVGLGLFLVIMWLLRGHPNRALIALGVIYTLEIGNEMIDGWIEWGRHQWIDVVDTWKDIVATVFWPTVLALVWRPLRKKEGVERISPS